MLSPQRIVRASSVAALVGLLTLVASTAAAGQDATGTLLVRVLNRADSTPVSGAFVRSGRIAGTTDPAGVAKVLLPARLVGILITHPSYAAHGFEMTILPGLSQRAEIYLEERSANAREAPEVARALVPPAAEPSGVVIHSASQVERALMRRPGDLGDFFSGPTIRIQALNGALDATELRIRGLRGQNTALLVDGLPLYGARLSAFGLLQRGAVELDAVEILPGSTTALHGTTAGAGSVNLRSRRPDRDRIRLVVDQSSEKGGDVAFWGARRFNPRVGGTFTADFHQQRLVDADEDGWGEFPRSIRLAVRPRLHLDAPNGDGMMATVGGLTEDRTGGFLVATDNPNPYREERQTRRLDGGLTAHKLDGAGGRWEARLAAVFQSTSHRFGALRERDERSFSFGELSYSRSFGQVAAVAGLGYQRDALRQRDLPAFDYTHSVPGAFGRVTVPLAERLTATVMGRCDKHNVHGTQCAPRASLLFHAAPHTDARLSIADGYAAPTPFADEVESFGLRATVPVLNKAERFRTASLDLNSVRGDWALTASLTYSRVSLPVRLVPYAGDPDRRLILVNVSEPTRMFAAEFDATYLGRSWSTRGYYGYLNGTEGVPGSTGRREADLTPRHTLGVEVTWRGSVPAAPTIAVDVAYVGAQSVYDNPFLSRTKAYPRSRAVATLRSGRARLFLTGDNLFDKKLRGFQQVVLAQVLAGGRRTTSPWLPLRGRSLTVGAVVDW